jgi:hypothetical protein
MNNSNNRVLYSVIGLVILLVVGALGVYAYQQRGTDKVNDLDSSNVDTETTDKNENKDTDELTNTSFKSEKGVVITLSSPTRGATVSSPLKVEGNAPGNWSHEGQFTVRILDNQSKVLAGSEAKVDGDWMTENPVAFTSELTFEAPKDGTRGLLVLEKANPSGLQENADSLTVPVQF